MASQVHENGWVSVPISEEWEARARAMRAERDAIYRNIYPESATDERWVGDLAEMAFASWLKHRKVPDYKWFKDDAAGRADFELGRGVSVGVKCVKRKVPPRAGYTMQITAQHAQEPVQQFFFLTYEFPIRRMWLLGGVSRDLFLHHAKFYRAGEWVHSKYQVPAGHDIYNTDISHISPPDQWLAQVLSV